MEELIAALAAHHIELLADIRAFPMSRRLPHFNRESLERPLPEAGIAYRWMPGLGGRRPKTKAASRNLGLRNQSFRNYADYMLTPPFHQAIAELLAEAERRPAAIMCAERVYFQCHRMLVSDFLTAHGHEVFHIEDERPARPHQLTAEARLVEGELLYTGDRLFS
jgi:uncharacterized protein (DUF488 family)